MQIKNKRQILSIVLTVLISVFLVAVFVYAATTIGANINTGGTLTVTGLTTLSSATSTSATTTAYLYVGVDITEPSGWNFSGGDLIVSDDAFINSQATTSASLWVGSGGTANKIDLSGGDLYVQDGVEIDGTLFGDRATTTSATTTNYLYVGSNFSLPDSIDYLGDLMVFSDAVINNKVTSTVALWVGSGGIADNINLTGGDLYVQNDVEIDGTLNFGAATSTIVATITGEEHGLATNYTGTLSSGDSMVGINSRVTTAGSAATWVSGIYAKVTQGSTKNVNGYISGAEFEVINSADNVSDWFPLVLNANNSGAQVGSHSSYIGLRDYGSTKIQSLLWIEDQTIGTLSATSLVSTTNDEAASHVLRIIIDDTPYWILLTSAVPN